MQRATWFYFYFYPFFFSKENQHNIKSFHMNLCYGEKFWKFHIFSSVILCRPTVRKIPCIIRKQNILWLRRIKKRELPKTMKSIICGLTWMPDYLNFFKKHWFTICWSFSGSNWWLSPAIYSQDWLVASRWISYYH